MHDNMGGMCGCAHHKAVPALITLIGLTFLARAMGWITPENADIAWPLFLTLIGVMKLTRGMCSCCKMHKDQMPKP